MAAVEESAAGIESPAGVEVDIDAVASVEPAAAVNRGASIEAAMIEAASVGLNSIADDLPREPMNFVLYLPSPRSASPDRIEVSNGSSALEPPADADAQKVLGACPSLREG